MTLTIKEIYERMDELNDWELVNNAITKQYSFNDFKEAMEFVNKVAGLCNTVEHRPDILIKQNAVILTLSTQNENGLTYKDFKLAKEIDNLLKQD